MSLIQAAEDSSNADNKVQIRFILDSNTISASRACAGVTEFPGLFNNDLFDREANLTFQYYLLILTLKESVLAWKGEQGCFISITR